MDHRLSRRDLIAGGLLLLPGCAEFSDRSPYWATIRRLAPGQGDDIRSEILKRAKEIPYASVEVGFGRAPQALMVLESFGDGGTFNWAGAGNQLMRTFGPVVIKLVGLEIDLTDTLLSSEWRADVREMVGRRVSRQVRYRADREVIVNLDSRFEIKGFENVELLDGPKTLMRVSESVSQSGQIRFRNHYWVEEESGFCWKSRQTPIPTLPVLSLRVLRAPRR